MTTDPDPAVHTDNCAKVADQAVSYQRQAAAAAVLAQTGGGRVDQGNAAHLARLARMAAALHRNMVRFGPDVTYAAYPDAEQVP